MPPPSDDQVQQAVYMGNLGLLSALLRAGGRPNTNEKPSHLWLAAFTGNVEAVIILLRAGACINTALQEDNAMEAAIMQSHLEVVRVLIRAGANLEISSDPDVPLVHYAIQRGEVSIFRELVRGGASPTRTSSSKKGALHVACKNGDLSIIRELLELGVDASSEDVWGRTPFWEASIAKNRGAMLELLQAGADPSFVDVRGLTPLVRAAVEQDMESLEILLSLGVLGRPAEKGGGIAMCLASSGNCIDAVRRLLQAGVDPGIQAWGMQGGTALHMAIGDDHDSDVARLLLRTNTELIEVEDKLGFKPLHFATANGSIGLVACLLRAGASVGGEETQIGSPAATIGKQGAHVGSPLSDAHIACIHRMLARHDAYAACSWAWPALGARAPRDGDVGTRANRTKRPVVVHFVRRDEGARRRVAVLSVLSRYANKV